MRCGVRVCLSVLNVTCDCHVSCTVVTRELREKTLVLRSLSSLRVSSSCGLGTWTWGARAPARVPGGPQDVNAGQTDGTR